MPRGSTALSLDPTGLYMGVVAPMLNLPSYRMCNSQLRMIGPDDFYLAEDATTVELQQWQEKALRGRLEQFACDFLVYEIGTGRLRQHLPQGFKIQQQTCCWSSDGRHVAIGALESKESRVLAVDRLSQECMWSLFDALKMKGNFWNDYPINLNVVQLEQMVD